MRYRDRKSVNLKFNIGVSFDLTNSSPGVHPTDGGAKKETRLMTEEENG